MSVLSNVLTKLGVDALGLSMPRINWSLFKVGDQVNLQEQPIDMAIKAWLANDQSQNNGAVWTALFAGTSQEIDPASGKDLNVHLVRPDGSRENGAGLLFTLLPQAYLRLERLYSVLLDTPRNFPTVAGGPLGPNAFLPPATRGVSFRQVPRYLFYYGPNAQANAGLKLNGNVDPGDELGTFSFLRIYDTDGMPVDPVSVLCCLNTLINYFPTLIVTPLLLADPPTSNMITLYTNLLAQNNNLVRVRLCDHNGAPVTSTSQFNGLNTSAPNMTSIGVYDLNTAGNNTTVGKAAGAPANMVIGSHHGSTLGNNVNLPLWTAVTGTVISGSFNDGQRFAPPGPNDPSRVPAMPREFFTIRVIDMDTFLLGTPDLQFTNVTYTDNNGDHTAVLEQKPAVRMGETLTLLTDGNQVLAGVAAFAGSAAAERQCIAQSIERDFVLPTGAGANSVWPGFTAGVNLMPGPIAIPNLTVNNLNLTAAYIGVPAGQKKTDVLLTFGAGSQLPVNTAIMVYPRKFVEDAKEARGDGVGTVVSSLPVSLVIRDPFSLIATGTDPVDATLRFDLMVVSNATAPLGGGLVFQLFSNLAVPVPLASSAAAPMPPVSNVFAVSNINTLWLSEARSGILGLDAPAITFGDFTDALFGTEDPNNGNMQANALNNPRTAPRLPTQAQRELIASDVTNAVISAGRIAGELLSAQARIGSPGSPGGRETQTVGVLVTGGLLSNDLGRAALRRTEYPPFGMFHTAINTWAPPGAPNSTFAGAVLQNIPPMVDYTAMYFLKDTIQQYAATRQGILNSNNTATVKLNNLVNWITGQLQNKNITIYGIDIPYGSSAADALSDARDSINDPSNAAFIDNPGKLRALNEIDRRVVTAVFGRRDTERALRGAIERARKFIYIESPGFASTHMDSDGNIQSNDLITLLKDRMTEIPTLRVMLCIPKYTDFPETFSTFRNFEYADRKYRIDSFGPLKDRLAVFHPIGFPGRASRLEATMIVVDDTWCLVGSSTFRQRGLFFDSGTDLVFADTVYENGFCPSIAMFRRQVMANRLGFAPTTNGLPTPNFTRLYNGVEAFSVVREQLESGGLGRIEPLYTPENLPSPGSSTIRQANPSGVDVIDSVGPGTDGLWVELALIEGFVSN